MSVQSSAQIPLGLAGEPPVSLPSEDGPELRAAPEPVETSPELRPPLEAQLVQQGKLSMGQLAQAHRDRMENGGSVLDIVVERGWVSAEDVAALRTEHGVEQSVAPGPGPVAAREPEPDPKPEPVVEAQPVPVVEAQPEPAPDPEPAPVPPAASTPGAFKVAIRLTNGELITAGEADSADKVEALAQVIVADLATQGDSWPRFGGRYLRPETILSVDIVSA